MLCGGWLVWSTWVEAVVVKVACCGVSTQGTRAVVLSRACDGVRFTFGCVVHSTLCVMHQQLI